mgnify:CR=1 FL=1
MTTHTAVEQIVFADGLTECPWCGGLLDDDRFGNEHEQSPKSTTCMSCYATFPYQAAHKWAHYNPLADDEDIPF